MIPVVAAATFLLQDPQSPPTPPKTASEEAREQQGEQAKQRGIKTAATTTTIQAIAAGNPLSLGMNFLTGALSAGIQARVASSAWAMTAKQKGAAEGIQGFLTKREKEPYTLTNSKVEGLAVLTISAKGMTREKADSLIKEEPLPKWRSCGWDRLIFTNGTDAWAISTEPAK